MTDQELMQMSLKELEKLCQMSSYPPDSLYDTINALRAKLIKPTQAEIDKDVALAHQANVLGRFTDLHPNMVMFVRLIRADEREQCAKAVESVVPRHTECGNKIAAAIRAREQG